MIIIFKNKKEKDSFVNILEYDKMIKHGADLIAISNNGKFEYMACSPAGHTTPRIIDAEVFTDIIKKLICSYARSVEKKLD